MIPYAVLANPTHYFLPVPYEGDSSLTTLGTVVTQVVSWMSDMISTITSSPILLLGVGMFVVGGAIGLARRLIKG